MPNLMILIRKHPYLSIFLCVLAVHGLSLFVTGIYWDGVITHTLYTYHNSSALYNWLDSMGIPFYYYYIKLLWFMGFGWVCNLIGFLSIFIAATFLFKSLRLYKSIRLDLALFSAFVLVIFPGSRITMFRAVSAYYFLYGLFFIGVYCSLKLETFQKKHGKYYMLRVLALVLLWNSFNLKSLLCYYLVLFVAMYFLSCSQRIESTFSIRNILKFSCYKIDFVLLPIIFWVTSLVFFKPHGAYVDYNSFVQIDKDLVLPMLWSSFFHAFVYYISPFLIVSLAIIIPLICLKQFTKIASLRHLKLGLFLMGLGLLAIFLSILPYVLVGKPLIYNFLPATRCNLLIPSASAIFFTGFATLFYVDAKGKLNIIGKLVCILLLVFGFMFWTKNYLVLNAWSAMQQSFFLKLKQQPKWTNYSLYWITVQDFIIPPAYANYAWSGYFDSAYGGQSHFGESDPEQLKGSFADYIQKFYMVGFKQQYSLKNFDPYGCQAIMIIIPGPSAGNPKRPGIIGLKYLYYKYFNPVQKEEFLNNLMKVGNKFYSTRYAKHCLKDKVT